VLGDRRAAADGRKGQAISCRLNRPQLVVVDGDEKNGRS